MKIKKYVISHKEDHPYSHNKKPIVQNPFHFIPINREDKIIYKITKTQNIEIKEIDNKGFGTYLNEGINEITKLWTNLEQSTYPITLSTDTYTRLLMKKNDKYMVVIFCILTAANPSISLTLSSDNQIIIPKGTVATYTIGNADNLKVMKWMYRQQIWSHPEVMMCFPSLVTNGGSLSNLYKSVINGEIFTAAYIGDIRIMRKLLLEMIPEMCGDNDLLEMINKLLNQKKTTTDIINEVVDVKSNDQNKEYITTQVRLILGALNFMKYLANLRFFSLAGIVIFKQGSNKWESLIFGQKEKNENGDIFKVVYSIDRTVMESLSSGEKRGPDPTGQEKYKMAFEYLHELGFSDLEINETDVKTVIRFCEITGMNKEVVFNKLGLGINNALIYSHSYNIIVATDLSVMKVRAQCDKIEERKQYLATTIINAARKIFSSILNNLTLANFKSYKIDNSRSLSSASSSASSSIGLQTLLIGILTTVKKLDVNKTQDPDKQIGSIINNLPFVDLGSFKVNVKNIIEIFFKNISVAKDIKLRIEFVMDMHNHFKDSYKFLGNNEEEITQDISSFDESGQKANEDAIKNSELGDSTINTFILFLFMLYNHKSVRSRLCSSDSNLYGSLEFVKEATLEYKKYYFKLLSNILVPILKTYYNNINQSNFEESDYDVFRFLLNLIAYGFNIGDQSNTIFSIYKLREGIEKAINQNKFDIPIAMVPVNQSPSALEVKPSTVGLGSEGCDGGGGGGGGSSPPPPGEDPGAGGGGGDDPPRRPGKLFEQDESIFNRLLLRLFELLKELLTIINTEYRAFLEATWLLFSRRRDEYALEAIMNFFNILLFQINGNTDKTILWSDLTQPDTLLGQSKGIFPNSERLACGNYYNFLYHKRLYISGVKRGFTLIEKPFEKLVELKPIEKLAEFLNLHMERPRVRFIEILERIHSLVRSDLGATGRRSRFTLTSDELSNLITNPVDQGNPIIPNQQVIIDTIDNAVNDAVQQWGQSASTGSGPSSPEEARRVAREAATRAANNAAGGGGDILESTNYAALVAVGVQPPRFPRRSEFLPHERYYSMPLSPLARLRQVLRLWSARINYIMSNPDYMPTTGREEESAWPWYPYKNNADPSASANERRSGIDFARPSVNRLLRLVDRILETIEVFFRVDVDGKFTS